MGKVYLVGAGPGDPGLITRKGLDCLRNAEVVVYDRLVNKRIVDEASAEAELLYVGKLPRQHALTQEDINGILVSKACEGKQVVRLKGGDPFVFGRGGEEIQALIRSHVPFEVVPGIPSAVAVPAYAGIPLTHRGTASSFTVVSGSEDPTKGHKAIDWQNLAKGTGTLVVLMAWENLPGIMEALRKHGRSAKTPVALIQWGTLPRQKTVVGTIGDIVEKGKGAGLTPPVIAIVGEVVRFREQFKWFEKGPLFGKRILVTRSRTQASMLLEYLSRLGADVVELPAIHVRPIVNTTKIDAALGRLDDYDWVVFSSVNGVEAVFQRLDAIGKDTRVFGCVHVGAIGPATAEALRQRGIMADYVPESYSSNDFVRGFHKMGISGKSFLIPRSSIGRKELPEGIIALGGAVDLIEAYETVAPEQSRDSARMLSGEEPLDVVTFTSSSTVCNLIRLLDGRVDRLTGATIACIGPVTADTARRAGLRVNIVASEHTMSGLVQALLGYFSGQKEETNGLS
jgi:uroporphyrinogen III methyltransferase/synthase